MDQPPALPGTEEQAAIVRSRAPLVAVLAVLIGVAVGVFLALSARQSPERAPLKSGWSPHTVKAAGFNLGLPPGWKSVSTTNVDTAYKDLQDANPQLASLVRDQLGSSLSPLIKFLAFDVNSPTLAQEFATNFNIAQLPLEDGTTFDGFLAQAITQIRNAPGVSKDVQSQRLELPAGESALIHAQWTIQMPRGPQVSAISQYLLLRSSTVYILSFTTLPSHLSQYSAVFDEIARTFRYQ